MTVQEVNYVLQLLASSCQCLLLRASRVGEPKLRKVYQISLGAFRPMKELVKSSSHSVKVHLGIHSAEMGRIGPITIRDDSVGLIEVITSGGSCNPFTSILLVNCEACARLTG